MIPTDSPTFAYSPDTAMATDKASERCECGAWICRSCLSCSSDCGCAKPDIPIEPLLKPVQPFSEEGMITPCAACGIKKRYHFGRGINHQFVAPKCDCWKHEHQVCDICQGAAPPEDKPTFAYELAMSLTRNNQKHTFTAPEMQADIEKFMRDRNGD